MAAPGYRRCGRRNMNCRKCKKEMTNCLVRMGEQSMAYDVCGECGSLWLDREEMDKMAFQVEGSIEYSSRDADADSIGEPKPCPRCDGKSLEAVKFLRHSDILLDRCPNCGGFLVDGGELAQINEELQKIMPVAGEGFSRFVIDAHLPYWRKRIRKQPSSKTDFKVPVPPLGGAELVSETELSCPACEGKLSRYLAFGIEIEGCPKCFGAFFNQEELRKLKDKFHQALWHNLRWMDDEVEAIEKSSSIVSDRYCPTCPDERLMATNLGASGVLVDCCPECHGVWLDEDEFRRIVSYLCEKLNEYSSTEMLAKAWEETKEMFTGPEGMISETRDTVGAVAALMNIVIFDHPLLHKLVRRAADMGRSIGLG